MSDRPKPGDENYNDWVTLANDVSRALGQAEVSVLFSKRNRTAEAMWDYGYRPTPEMVDAEIQRQRERDKAWGNLR